MHAKHDTRVRIFLDLSIAGSTTIIILVLRRTHMGAATIVDAQISTMSRFLAISQSETIDVPIYNLGHDGSSGAAPRFQNRFAI